MLGVVIYSSKNKSKKIFTFWNFKKYMSLNMDLTYLYIIVMFLINRHTYLKSVLVIVVRIYNKCQKLQKYFKDVIFICYFDIYFVWKVEIFIWNFFFYSYSEGDNWIWYSERNHRVLRKLFCDEWVKFVKKIISGCLFFMFLSWFFMSL